MTSARAIATRCCSPPDSMPGLCARRSPRPTRSSSVRRAAVALGRRPPRDPQRHPGVLERRELRQQMMELEHEADVPVAERRQLVGRHAREVGVADRARAGVERVEPAEHVQQRALADAGRADDRDHLAPFDASATARAAPAAGAVPTDVALVDAGGFDGTAISGIEALGYH